MTDSLRAAVDDITAQIRNLHIDLYETSWKAATTGSSDALMMAAATRGNWMRFWADPDLYEQVRAWDEDGAAGDDPALAREVLLLHLKFAGGQRDPSTIEEMTELVRALDDAYTNFRPEVEGERLTANDIVAILRTETDSDRRQLAWEASKAIGLHVASQIQRLAVLRNEAAHTMGFDNFHRMSLTLNELDPDWLYGMLDDLAAQTEEPFRQVKGELDAALSERFGVPVEELMPWHYADPFFQKAPMVGAVDYDVLFEGRDLTELALRTYDGLGMEVRDILERSDLYEREGKDQHAFCMHVDREGDVRVLCNLEPTLRWMETLLHELGHAVYDKYIPRDLPWMLRTFPHLLTTEAMALLMGALTLDPAWHAQVMGAPDDDAAARGTAGAERFRLEELIFARWVMVMVNFERAMYEDPARDLNTLWWDLVQQYQLLNKPPEREAFPDWATKYHVALAPAYYQNYLLGRMTALQWQGWLEQEVGGIVGREDAGAFFREQIFALGNTMHWNDALEHATGEPLNPDYFVARFT
jgi:peptidyl-dipeptidase A